MAFEKHYPERLSGGMKQRVGIVRALATGPKVLLLDEPFGALDAQTRIIMQQILTNLWQRLKISVLFVTHDIDEAIFLSDRVYCMTARPGSIKAEIPIPLERPRQQSMMMSSEFLALRRGLMSLIREESLKAMGGEINDLGMQGLNIDLHGHSLAENFSDCDMRPEGPWPKRDGPKETAQKKSPAFRRDHPRYSMSPELASLAGVLCLLTRLLLAAALLLLIGLLARLLLTRILGLLARVLVWIAHSGSPLLNTSGDQPLPDQLVAREQGFPDVFNVSIECPGRGSGTGCKNNPVQALWTIRRAVAAPGSHLLENGTTRAFQAARGPAPRRRHKAAAWNISPNSSSTVSCSARSTG